MKNTLLLPIYRLLGLHSYNNLNTNYYKDYYTPAYIIYYIAFTIDTAHGYLQIISRLPILNNRGDGATENQYIIRQISAFLHFAKPPILQYNFIPVYPYVNLSSLNQYWFKRIYLNYYYLSFINHTYSLTTRALLNILLLPARVWY